jgi:hypothetical protein
MDLYIHSHTRLHGIVLRAGTILLYFTLLYFTLPRRSVEYYLGNTVLMHYGKLNMNLVQQQFRFPLPPLQSDITPPGTLPEGYLPGNVFLPDPEVIYCRAARTDGSVEMIYGNIQHPTQLEPLPLNWRRS